VSREVVLVPGLWMPRAALALLAARLRAEGFETRTFGYPGRAPFEDNLERFATYCRHRGEGEACFVGHSLGGVLILRALSRHPDIAASSVVLIGSPVRGCLAGRRFARRPLGRWMVGRSAPLWEECEPRWTRGEPLGVIAGTCPAGLGRLLYRLPAPNDGVVTVSETEVSGMRDRALVAVSHSGLIVSRRVSRLAATFLRESRFR
jgi:pimeloyl-ACP methyl ester carboxylesterase